MIAAPCGGIAVVTARPPLARQPTEAAVRARVAILERDAVGSELAMCAWALCGRFAGAIVVCIATARLSSVGGSVRNGSGRAGLMVAVVLDNDPKRKWGRAHCMLRIHNICERLSDDLKEQIAVPQPEGVFWAGVVDTGQANGAAARSMELKAISSENAHG